jgi:hypothetical protein
MKYQSHEIKKKKSPMKPGKQKEYYQKHFDIASVYLFLQTQIDRLIAENTDLADTT